MFKPGYTYRVKKQILHEVKKQILPILQVGDIVVMKQALVSAFKVVRQSDNKTITVPSSKADLIHFEEQTTISCSINGVSPLPKPVLPYYIDGPSNKKEPAITPKGKFEIKSPSFPSVELKSVRQKDVPGLPLKIFGDQKKIDRAAITLLAEGLKNGTVFVDTVVDELTGTEREQLFVADVWSGRFNAYEESDKDHIYNQQRIISTLTNIKKLLNSQNEFDKVLGEGLITRAGGDTIKSTITQGTVVAQYGNVDNLGFSGKALNQRTKNDASVFDTISQSLLHSNLSAEFSGESILSKTGEPVGKRLKRNLSSVSSKAHLERHQKARKVYNTLSGQTTRVLLDEKQGQKARSENRRRKFNLETGAFDILQEDIDSENDDDLSDIETIVPRNLKRTLSGIREGKKVDIDYLEKRKSRYKSKYKESGSRFSNLLKEKKSLEEENVKLTKLIENLTNKPLKEIDSHNNETAGTTLKRVNGIISNAQSYQDFEDKYIRESIKIWKFKYFINSFSIYKQQNQVWWNKLTFLLQVYYYNYTNLSGK